MKIFLLTGPLTPVEWTEKHIRAMKAAGKDDFSEFVTGASLCITGLSGRVRQESQGINVGNTLNYGTKRRRKIPC
jgi:hypothetical protein